MQYTYDVDSFSDLHKDAYGFRPSGSFYQWMNAATPDELQAEWDSLLRSLEYSIREQEDRETECLQSLEKEIAWMLNNGADSVATCVRWLDDMYNTDGDYMYLDYKLGVKYGTIAKLVNSEV